MKVQFVNEAISVEVMPRQAGESRPLAFVWRGRRLQIESWGRDGSETLRNRAVHCHLVQTVGFETWELCQDIETAQWTLVRHWARNAPIA